MVRVVEYVDARGSSPYARWFASLNEPAAAKVAVGLHRLFLGNFANVKGVGAGVFERKIDFGPGYRIYFGRDGESLIVLLGGSTKQRQSEAIAAAIHAGATTGEGSHEGRPMALTRDFRVTIVARARRDHRFSEALLTEAINAYLGGETAVGRSILRDLVNATVGFEGLALEIGRPSKSLHRMLGVRGNPSSENFFEIVQALQRHLRVKLRVSVRAA